MSGSPENLRSESALNANQHTSTSRASKGKTQAGNRVKTGDVVDCVGNHGYLHVSVDYGRYLVHRLIWLWHKGYLPEGFLDHIDKNRLNNRVENLREVSRACNLRNTGNQQDNKSGVKGVCWDSRKCCWLASIGVRGKNIFLGYSGDFLEAVCLRLAAEQAEGWAGCDSRSPAHAYLRENL